MSFVLKVVADGEARHIPLHSTPDFAVVQAALAQGFPSWHAYTLKYEDDEGDLCTLVESTFDDFLAMASAVATDTEEACVLKVGLFPTQTSSEKMVPSSLHPVPQRRNARKKQPLARSEWAHDPRDLEELVQQFTSSDAKKKARKKKCKQMQIHGQASSCSEHDPEFVDKAIEDEGVEKQEQQVEETEGDNQNGKQNKKEEVDSTADSQELLSQDYETDDEAMWEQRDARMSCIKCDIKESLYLEPETLRRSSSCPCAPTWLAEQESLRNDLSQYIPGEHVDIFSGSDPVVELMPQNYTPLMWMPVLLPWPVNDFSSMPHIGMVMPIAACH